MHSKYNTIIYPQHPPSSMWIFNKHWPIPTKDDWTLASLNCKISSAETKLERLGKSCPQQWFWLFLSNTQNICTKSDGVGYYLSCSSRKAEDLSSFFSGVANRQRDSHWVIVEGFVFLTEESCLICDHFV